MKKHGLRQQLSVIPFDSCLQFLAVNSVWRRSIDLKMVPLLPIAGKRKHITTGFKRPFFEGIPIGPAMPIEALKKSSEREKVNLTIMDRRIYSAKLDSPINLESNFVELMQTCLLRLTTPQQNHGCDGCG